MSDQWLLYLWLGGWLLPIVIVAAFIWAVAYLFGGRLK